MRERNVEHGGAVRAFALPLLALAALAGSAGDAFAAGPEELFCDAAWAGKLARGDVGMLDLDGPQCYLGAKRPAIFCVGYTRATDGSQRWDGVFVGPLGVEKTARLQYLTAAGAADSEDPTDDAEGRATVNKALRKVRWSERLAWSHDYRLVDGRLAGDPEQTVTLPDGRSATITARGVSVADGTTLAVAPVPGRPLTRVTLYAEANSRLLVAAIDDAAANRRDAPSDSRFVVGAAYAPPDPGIAPDGDATCPAGVWCPPHYSALKPLLDRFCAGDFGADALAATAALAARGALDGEDLAVLFNAYGALYAYVFKQKTEYNIFYYGEGLPTAVAAARAWLPHACRDAVGKYTTETLPSSLREARDGVKRLWRQHK